MRDWVGAGNEAIWGLEIGEDKPMQEPGDGSVFEVEATFGQQYEGRLTKTSTGIYLVALHEHAASEVVPGSNGDREGGEIERRGRELIVEVVNQEIRDYLLDATSRPFAETGFQRQEEIRH